MRKFLATLMILVLLSTLVGVAGAQAPEAVDLTLGVVPPFVSGSGGGSVPNGGNPDILLDDFNRGDGPLGPNWTVLTGTCGIVSQAARCSYGNAYWNAVVQGGSTAEADIKTNGTPLQYAGVTLHVYPNTYNYPFLKFQDQSSDGKFEYGGCYLGNNGAGGTFGLGFYALSQPFASAHLKATQSGTTVTIELTNIEGGTLPDQTYVCTGAPAAAGDHAGILGYANLAQNDNFAIGGVVVDYVFATHVRIFSFGLPSYIVGGVRAATGNGATPVAGATVDVMWTVPIGGGYMVPQSRTTNASGLAFPVMLPNWPGTYVLDLVNITAAGFTYDPNMNWESSATFTLP